MTHGFSCEHCGRPERHHAERACDFCDAGMCFDCTEAHDAIDACPSDVQAVVKEIP